MGKSQQRKKKSSPQSRRGRVRPASAVAAKALEPTPHQPKGVRGTFERAIVSVGMLTWVLIGLLLAALVTLGIAWTRGGDPVASDVNAQLASNPGSASFSIRPDIDAMPVLCGCQDPAAFQETAATQSWGGALIPTTSFELNVAQDGHNLPWQLSMYAPDSGASNWLNSRGFPIDVTVSVERGKSQQAIEQYAVRTRDTRQGQYVFPVGVGEITLVTRGAVLVAPTQPLVSLMPAAGSETTAGSTGGARDYAASFMTFDSDVPSRDALGSAARADPTTENVFRGDTLDLAGGASLSFVAEDGTEVYIGTHAVPLPAGQTINLQIKPTAFSLRLLPSPLTSSGADRIARDGKADQAEGRNDMGDGASSHVFSRPIEQLPAYEVQLARAVSPTQEQWAALLQLAEPRSDSEGTGWPPLSEERQVDIFGSLTALSGNSFVGSVAVKGDTVPVVKGDDFEISSDAGMVSEPFRPVLHLSSGSSAATSELSGNAMARTDGDAVALSPKPELLITLLIGLVWILVGMLLEALLVRRS